MRNKTSKGSSDYDTLDLATACLEVDEPHFPIFFLYVFPSVVHQPIIRHLTPKGVGPSLWSLFYHLVSSGKLL